MHRSLFLIVLCALASTAFAQDMFRYIDKDGRVVYSDAAPPPDASKVQRKRLGGNYIDTSEQPYAYQIAQQRNPVTLYSGACGPTCDTARALLNRRGVPFRDIDPSQPGEAVKMKEAIGEMVVPVLLIGGAITLKGYEEGAWQSALDTAGYPKTPPPRVMTIRRDSEKAAAEKVAGKPPVRK